MGDCGCQRWDFALEYLSEFFRPLALASINLLHWG
jgi:hypothetical protein